MYVLCSSGEYAYARPLRPDLETIDLDAYESLKRVCGMAIHFFKVSGHQFFWDLFILLQVHTSSAECLAQFKHIKSKDPIGP